MNTMENLKALLPEYEIEQDKDGMGNPYHIIDNSNALKVAVILRGIPDEGLPAIAEIVRESFTKKLRS